ncbi:MAG: class I SAM-dependent methyltransferase [Bacteroidia bacterium]|jgi:2-polyprenyl-3-methyl-5-hydroxy-6-metoxy-1,4-benzoquinol methylase|nr:class I SAM-dependent methyltransferase [Bacteroidia bacterium]
MTHTKPSCPICRSAAEPVYTLGRDKILSALNRFFNTRFDQAIVPTDYTMHRCPACTLVFPEPMLPGNDAFYHALVKQPGYYSDYRPEYDVVADLIGAPQAHKNILDIGCGEGDFLVLMRKRQHTALEGIDTTEASVTRCREKGLNVTNSRIETFGGGPFQAITAFHCLEHVDDPLAFIRHSMKLLAPGGKLYIATPYSPQVSEMYWFHPLNHPPHHLLRLNEKSYLRLAAETGTKAELINFQHASFTSMIRSAFSFAVYGENRKGSSLEMMGRMLLHPMVSYKVIKNMWRREKIKGRTAGSDILVVFTAA